MTTKRPPLLISVLCELGRGNISEKYIPGDYPFPSKVREFVDGTCEGRQIVVNPITETVNTVLHELLHRLHGEWSENYVRNRTTYLMKRMTDDEIQQVYSEYQKAVKRGRKRSISKRSEILRGSSEVRPDPSQGPAGRSDPLG